MRPRKLFPAPTATNQTGGCQDFCDAACPESCYNYSEFNFQPPPQSPPPHLAFHTLNIATYVIIILIILAILFLAVSIYLLVLKSRSGWFRSRDNWHEPQSQTDNNRDEELHDEVRTVVHPIWFITRMGLHQSTINSIAVVKYRKGEGLIEGTECSVCLNEFQEDENLRRLPKCNHAFHISCIDTWLRSHTNCPLCRANIVDVGVDAPLIAVNSNSDHLNAIVGPQMENPVTNVELGNAQERNQAYEGRGGAGEERREVRHVGDKGHLNALGLHTAGSGEGSNARQDTVLKEEVDSDGNGDRQQTRRSLSMDHLTNTSIRLVPDDHSPIESQGSSLVNQMENTEKTGSDVVSKQAIGQCMHNGPDSMKRSSSS